MTDASGDEPARRASLRWRALAVALWVCFVWGHSLVGGAASTLESSRFVALVRPLLEAVGVTDPSTMAFLVRKAAHFSEYAVLGCLLVWLWDGLVQRTPRAGWICRAVGVAVPVLDETIQLFVPGRAGSPRDVLIDLAGACTGCAAAWLVRRHALRQAP